MARMLDPQNPQRGILLARRLTPPYLWNLDTLPSQAELCVLDGAHMALFCTPGMPASFREEAPRRITSAKGEFESSQGGTDVLASYWSLPLRHDFSTPGWVIVLTESKADALAPVANFKTSFPLVFFYGALGGRAGEHGADSQEPGSVGKTAGRHAPYRHA